MCFSINSIDVERRAKELSNEREKERDASRLGLFFLSTSLSLSLFGSKTGHLPSQIATSSTISSTLTSLNLPARLPTPSRCVQNLPKAFLSSHPNPTLFNLSISLISPR